MRGCLRALRRGAALGLATALVTIETLLAAAWVRGTLYAARYGAEENPYAAEDADISGICALILLPLAMLALAWAVYEIILWTKRGNAPSEK